MTFTRDDQRGRLKCANGARQCVFRTPPFAATLLFAAALLAGCGGNQGPERSLVSGTITYAGKPISAGTIRFVPLPTCPAPASAADIVDGQYKVNMHGGVPVGTHRIQIEAYRDVPGSPKPNPSAAGPPWTRVGQQQQYLPKKYNTDSQLEIKIEPGSREIVKNFELTD
jgi:hypothetical protein